MNGGTYKAGLRNAGPRRHGMQTAHRIDDQALDGGVAGLGLAVTIRGIADVFQLLGGNGGR